MAYLLLNLVNIVNFVNVLLDQVIVDAHLAALVLDDRDPLAASFAAGARSTSPTRMHSDKEH